MITNEILLRTFYSALFNVKIEKKDKIFFEQIRQIRKNLCKDNSEIWIEDFGAGSRFTKKKQIYKTEVKKICKKTSTSDLWGRFFYLFIKQTNIVNALELGTGLGFASAYISKNLKGQLITVEGAKQIYLLANQKVFKPLKLANVISVNQTFEKFLESFNQKTKFQLVYIDGHHYSKALFKYMKLLEPFLEKNSLVIFDDILWSFDMFKFWLKIQKKFKNSLLMGNKGFCWG